MSSRPLRVNVDKWIVEHQHAFLPPVCNKLMHFSQLLVMFVGGPNTRKDFHIEEGEELFFQLKGDMCLKVIENGNYKDVHIKEGEMFLLPARTPHSPQRLEDTVGLVVERRRLLTETDCLRYYVDGTTDILFERWFYCEDLGTQLVPIIKEFMQSTQCKTKKPNTNEVFREPPFQLNTMDVMSPFSFRDWLDKHRPSLSSGRSVSLFGPQFETEVLVFGPGRTDTSVQQSDVWIWQMEGSSVVTTAEDDVRLSAGDSLLVPEQSWYRWQRDEGTVALSVVQNPDRKKPGL